jgi:hypothetical protein
MIIPDGFTGDLTAFYMTIGVLVFAFFAVPLLRWLFLGIPPWKD